MTQKDYWRCHDETKIKVIIIGVSYNLRPNLNLLANYENQVFHASYIKNAMKFVAVFVLVFGCGLCFGQGIRFKLYRTGPCTTTEYLDTAYSLYKAPFSIDTEFFPKNGIVYLPHIGKFKVYFNDGPISDTVIDIADTGLFIFRYAEPYVGLYPGGLDMPPV